MNKSTHFFGQSVFGQLISMIDTNIIIRNGKRRKADHYVKRFKARDHLISMFFRVFAKCSSLREVTGAMLGLSGKTRHFGLGHIPYRSTLFYRTAMGRYKSCLPFSEATARRSYSDTITISVCPDNQVVATGIGVGRE